MTWEKIILDRQKRHEKATQITTAIVYNCVHLENCPMIMKIWKIIENDIIRSISKLKKKN